MGSSKSKVVNGVPVNQRRIHTLPSDGSPGLVRLPSRDFRYESSPPGLRSAFANTSGVRSAPSMPSTAQIRLSSAPTLEDLEETEVHRAIALSMSTGNNSNHRTYDDLFSRNLGSTSQNRTNNVTAQNRTSNVTTQNQKGNLANAKKSATSSDSKLEMAFDCSICMELNEEEVIVATECGHLFHKGCVSPWIQQAGTCPSCRVRITITSLRKIFVSVSSSSNATTSQATNPGNGNTNKNKNKVNKDLGSGNNNSRRYRRAPASSATTFNRSVWLGSSDKQLTEQSISNMIVQRFNLTSQSFSVRSLQKKGAPQPTRYVSFKISVQSESAFNSLLVSSRWPVTYRVREFIERN